MTTQADMPHVQPIHALPTKLAGPLAGFFGALAAGTAIGLACLPPQALGATDSTSNPLSVALMAAPAQGASGHIEVRLAWSLQDGWLPAGGFNVYRSGGSAPVNGTPLGGSLANAPATLPIGTAHTLQLGALLGKASTAPSTGTLPPLTTTIVRGSSAATRFNQLATTAQQGHSLAPPKMSSTTTSTSAAR